MTRRRRFLRWPPQGGSIRWRSAYRQVAANVAYVFWAGSKIVAAVEGGAAKAAPIQGLRLLVGLTDVLTASRMASKSRSPRASSVLVKVLSMPLSAARTRCCCCGSPLRRAVLCFVHLKPRVEFLAAYLPPFVVGCLEQLYSRGLGQCSASGDSRSDLSDLRPRPSLFTARRWSVAELPQIGRSWRPQKD